MRRCRPLFLLLILWMSGYAQMAPYSLGGYVKYMFSSTRFPNYPQRLNDHLIHVRLNSRWYAGDYLQAAAEFRFRALYGGSVQHIPDYLNLLKSHYDFAQLDAVLWDKKKTLGYGQVDRLWLDYTRGNLEATLGRQRIAWGTALVWNVIDLFNPQSVLDFDYEEKPGADALRLQYYTGPVSRMELAVKPGKTLRRGTAAGLWSVNAFEYDLFLLGGIRDNRWLGGGAWAGHIGGAGFRGEFLWSQAPVKSGFHPYLPIIPGFGRSFYHQKQAVFSGVLSADYTFANSFYIHGELLYNSNGKTENAGLFYQQALRLGMLSPARWNYYQEFAYDITPLVRGTLFGIYNPDDRSYIWVPYLNWSVATNLDLTAVAFFARGEPLSEYGGYGNSYFLRLKYSF